PGGGEGRKFGRHYADMRAVADARLAHAARQPVNQAVELAVGYDVAALEEIPGQPVGDFLGGGLQMSADIGWKRLGFDPGYPAFDRGNGNGEDALPGHG